GGLGGTYGGNPVACAAALAALATIAELELTARARAIGATLLGRLAQLRERHAVIGDVRGRGAMIAIELVRPGSGAPHPCAAQASLANDVSGHVQRSSRRPPGTQPVRNRHDSGATSH